MHIEHCRIIPCYITSTCECCGRIDDIPHFFANCLKVNKFWSYWMIWWEHHHGIAIKNSPVLKEYIYIIIGFPLNSDVIHLLNVCLHYVQNIFIFSVCFMVIN